MNMISQSPTEQRPDSAVFWRLGLGTSGRARCEDTTSTLKNSTNKYWDTTAHAGTGRTYLFNIHMYIYIHKYILHAHLCMYVYIYIYNYIYINTHVYIICPKLSKRVRPPILAFSCSCNRGVLILGFKLDLLFDHIHFLNTFLPGVIGLRPSWPRCARESDL